MSIAPNLSPFVVLLVICCGKSRKCKFHRILLNKIFRYSNVLLYQLCPVAAFQNFKCYSTYQIMKICRIFQMKVDESFCRALFAFFRTTAYSSQFQQNATLRSNSCSSLIKSGPTIHFQPLFGRLRTCNFQNWDYF